MTARDVDWPADLLRERRDRSPERIALVDADRDRSWTYAELDSIVDRITGSLADAGVGPGETVATLLDSRPMAVGLLFATIRTGATFAPLNVALDHETLADQIGRLDPALVLCESDTEAAAVSSFDGTIHSLDPPEDGNVDRFGMHSFAPKKADSHDSVPGTALAADEPALVVFTSGTTGHPKGVRLTAENLYSSALASATRLGVTPRDGWLSPLSTYHVGGIAPFLRAALYGTTAVLQRQFDATETAAVLERPDVTCVSLVPTMLTRMLDHGWRSGPDLRFVLLGGGPAPESLLERCREHAVPVCPTYGATETASQVATAKPGTAIDHPGTVGRPLASATVTILADGVPCDPGETGELVVEGPMVSPGYLDVERTDPRLDGERFRTGDLGYRDGDGRLWIVGRADDGIVSGGENVRPSVVESALTAHRAVAEAAVVGVADPEWGERVVALVVPEAAPPDVDTVRAFVRDRIPAYAVPKSIRVADALPRTPSGTVDRDAVADHFE